MPHNIISLYRSFLSLIVYIVYISFIVSLSSSCLAAYLNKQQSILLYSKALLFYITFSKVSH